MATDANSANSNRSKFVYSREKLFSHAKSMKGIDELSEELARFENADYTKYNLDLLQEFDEHNSPEQFLSLQNRSTNHRFERQTSDMSSKFDDYKRAGGGFKTNRISRMTSSPNFKYKHAPGGFNVNEDATNLFDSEGLSSQVREKHAKLLESYRMNKLPGAPIGRLSSNDHQSTARYVAPERPNSVFGPPRRDYRRDYDERRNSSDGPQSLPFFSAQQTTRNYKINHSMADDNYDAEDQLINSSPVKRFTSSSSTDKQTEFSPSNIDEDDFDITSLLSITVLSDIRTIRQESSVSTRQQSVGKLTRQSSSRHKNDQINAVGGFAKPPLTRARTATDFTYSGRRQQQQFPVYQHESGNHHSQLATSDYRSLIETSLRSQADSSYYATREMARTSLPADSEPTAARVKSDSLQTRNNKEPIDEKALKIIQTFQEQVKARARSAQIAADPGEQLSENKSADTERAEAAREFKRQHENASDKGPTNGKAEVDDSASEPKSSVASDRSSAGMALEKRQAVTGGDGREASDPAAAGERRANLSRSESVAAEVNIKPVAPLISHIPRLISLLNKQTATKAAPAAATTHEKLAKATSLSASQGSSSNQAAGKFVSKYGTLRGKSLADEVTGGSKK